MYTVHKALLASIKTASEHITEAKSLMLILINAYLRKFLESGYIPACNDNDEVIKPHLKLIHCLATWW